MNIKKSTILHVGLIFAIIWSNNSILNTVVFCNLIKNQCSYNFYPLFHQTSKVHVDVAFLTREQAAPETELLDVKEIARPAVSDIYSVQFLADWERAGHFPVPSNWDLNF